MFAKTSLSKVRNSDSLSSRDVPENSLAATNTWNTRKPFWTDPKTMGFKQVVEQLDPATMRSGETQEDDATDELAVTSRTKGELDSWKPLGVRPSSCVQSRVHPVRSRATKADHNINNTTDISREIELQQK